MSESENQPIDPGLRPLAEQAVADLAARLDVAPDAISIESALLTTWSDRGFLGGVVAELRQTQVPADGSEIVLYCRSHQRPGPYRYRTGGTVYQPTLHFEDRRSDHQHSDHQHSDERP